MIEIIPIETPSLGDRSYLVSDGQHAFVVDPQRDIDRVLALAEQRDVRITDVFETHIHNDYVTGGLALTRAVGATYHVNAADQVAYDRAPISDGDVIEVGPVMRVHAMATPGHTFTHLSYLLHVAGRPEAVFTGGSLLFGSTGRPDLLGPENTPVLVHAQFASVRRLAEALPDGTEVYPTHGFGSFCSATQSDAATSTIGREKQVNPVLTQEESAYVKELLAGLDAWPAYYTHMAAANTGGPAAPDLSPPAAADPDELRRRIAAGEWVVDLRTRTAFAAGHLLGSLNVGMDGEFATYVGWLMPWGTPLTLLGETAEQVTGAQRELVRIGIDRIEASATGSPDTWSGGASLGSYPTASFANLADVRHHRAVTVLDVRRSLEWAGGHVRGAVHIPLHELLDRFDEAPKDEVWIYCHSGYRASIAASVLAAAGRRVVVLDDQFERAATAGLTLESSPRQAVGR